MNDATFASAYLARENIILRVMQRTGMSRDIVVAEVDRQLQDGVDPVQTWMPATRTEYRDIIGERIQELLELAKLSGLCEHEARKMLQRAAGRASKGIYEWPPSLSSQASLSDGLPA